MTEITILSDQSQQQMKKGSRGAISGRDSIEKEKTHLHCKWVFFGTKRP
ncbi:MAG: hypothetical protein IPM82_06355 [Saprospiraceae bacterium]|nr:hypothetical protein [Saprospiraceae bacterium]